MKNVRIFTGFSFILFLILLQQALVQTSCANIIPPAGGTRDSLPPVLVSAKPADSSKNFKDKRIVLTFDEYVEIQDVQKNLLVSPIPKITPTVERKLNTITIGIRDTLQPNTTYTFDFGNSIKDLNEGNVFKNFSYIFTTGDYFDSLTLHGKVILATDGSIDTTLSVMLHKNRADTAVSKEKPKYVAKLDKQGNFKFRYLPSDTFAIYAIKDEGGTYRFSGREQLFAFADKPVVAGDTSFIYLYAFPDNEGASTSLPIKRQQALKDKRLVLKNNLDNNQQSLLKDFVLSSEVPFKTFDTTKIVLAADTSYTPQSGFYFIHDSTNKNVTLKYQWKENTRYHLILDKDFGADTLGQKLLKSDTISFTTKKASEYGSLRIHFLHLDMTQNPMVLFVQNNAVVDSAVLTSPVFFRPVFNPGEYSLRILRDDNKNGKWDPGIFFGKHQQPELIKPLAQKVVVKANWDNDTEKDVNALPPPEHNPQNKGGLPPNVPNRRN
jgi:hypothetical protein